MKRLYLNLIPTLVLVLQVSCVTTPVGWTYNGREGLNPQDEKRLFEESHDQCNRRLRAAQEAVREYGMKADPNGAYEHCMQARGWQPVNMH